MRRGIAAAHGVFRPREVLCLVFGFCGAVLLAVISQRYRVDLMRCSAWPILRNNLLYAGLYIAALALLCGAWLGLGRYAAAPQGLSLRRVLLYATSLHLIVLCGAPCFSDDVLYYAALSRALAHSNALKDAAAPLCSLLSPQDRFVNILDAHWRCIRSPYLSGFHLIAWSLGKLGRQDLALHLRLYQCVAALAMLLSAYVTALALRESPQPSSPRPAFGAAVVALNPISLIEGTLNAHNDTLLALGCALLVLAVKRRRSLHVILTLGLSLTVKASALLVCGLYGTQALLRGLRQRSPWLKSALWGCLGLALCIGLAILIRLPNLIPGVSGLFGSPTAPWEYCTRSLECLPRAILRWGLHRPTAAWLVGLGFRGLGGLWLLYAAWRCHRQNSPLPWLATGLLIYYLFLHSWSQSWYFLLLLPLLPWAQSRTRAALCTVCISGCGYYALMFVGNCVRADLEVALIDLIEGLIVVVPPSLALWPRHRRTMRHSSRMADAAGVS